MDRQLTIPVDGGSMQAYLSRPDDEGRHPAIIIIHDIYGLSEHYKDVARRLTEQGYVALVPDLFWNTELPDFSDRATFMKFRQSVDDPAMLRAMDAAVDYLKGQDFVDPGRIGIIGFCFGGLYAMLEATHNPAIAAVGDFYGGGMNYQETSPTRPRSPMDAARDIRAPFLGLFGEEDQSIPVEQVHQLLGILRENGVPNEFHVYPNAGHAFFNDTQPSYREHAARDSWQRLLDFFGRHLKKAA